MKCPSCGAPFTEPPTRCPQCKFSLEKGDLKFGLVPACSRLLTDRSGALSLAEVRELRKALRLFHKKFPQSLFTIFVVELLTGTAVAEFAYWMANRARFTSADKLRGENCNLLLVVDMAARSAALNAGYGLEPHVPEDALQKPLDDFAEAFATDGLAAALQTLIDSLSAELRQLAGQARASEPREARSGVESW